jgi:hypothetical protein
MERRKRLAATLGLVALVLLDIVLVFAALRLFGRGQSADEPYPVAVPTQALESAAPSPSAPSLSTASTATSAGSSTTTGTPTATPPTPLTRIITAVDGSTAWRASTGSCLASGAALSFTSDGGKTWQNAKTPYPVVTRIAPTDASRAFVVGGDPNCVMGTRSTVDSGTTWTGTGPGTLSDILARDIKDPTKVRVPGGRTVAPCGTLSVVDLARNSTTGAEALCADGSIRSTTDDGRTWPQVGQVPGALALSSRVTGGTTTAYLALQRDGCAGVALSAVADGVTTELGCAATGSAVPGQVALSAPTADAGWLLVGNDTWRSSDGLATWNRAG